MIFTFNKAFVNSSLLVRAKDGNHPDFLHNLYFNRSIQLCINDVGLSEFLFPFTELIPLSEETLFVVPDLISRYNLLPDDATILATCKFNDISTLAFYDTDLLTLAKKRQYLC